MKLEKIPEYLTHTKLSQGLVDDFDLMQDIDSALYPIYQQYCDAISKNNFSSAAKILAINSGLKKCIFNAEKYNKFRDAIIGLEEIIVNEMILDFKSDYNSNTKYSFGDIVIYTVDGIRCAYMCARNNTPAGTLPTNEEYFVQLTLKGEKGDEGAKGANLAFKGSYNTNTQYQKYDLVYCNGAVYWAKQNVKGVKPPNSSYWDLFLLQNVTDGSMIADGTLNGSKLSGNIKWSDLKGTGKGTVKSKTENLNLSLQDSIGIVDIDYINSNFTAIDSRTNKIKEDNTNVLYKLGIENGLLYIQSV